MRVWNKRFMELAKLVASWSKDPSTQCGAVIVDNKRIVSVGFNGFPRGVRDDESLYSDRTTKYPRVLHAEANAMAFAYRDLVGCTIYIWPMLPCAQCAAMIVQRGIKRVVSINTQPERWTDSINFSLGLFEEAGVLVTLMDPLLQ